MPDVKELRALLRKVIRIAEARGQLLVAYRIGSYRHADRGLKVLLDMGDVEQIIADAKAALAESTRSANHA